MTHGFSYPPTMPLGHALERDASAVVEEHKGKVLGTVRHPLGTSDFASYLLAAQASKAKVIALASSGSDLINVIKQADEFGITAGGHKVAALTCLLQIRIASVWRRRRTAFDVRVLLGSR